MHLAVALHSLMFFPSEIDCCGLFAPLELLVLLIGRGREGKRRLDLEPCLRLPVGGDMSHHAETD